MKVITIISSMYQDAFRYEIENYTFALHMFSTFDEARKNINRMNIEDNLGYIYLDDELKDLTGFIDFIDKIDIYSSSERNFVVAVKNKEDLKSALANIKTKMIKTNISVVRGFEFVSDKLIGSCIYDVISKIRSPYMLRDNSNTSDKVVRINTLQYTSLFNPKLELVLGSKKIINDNPEDTCEVDSFCNEYRFKSPELYKLREAFIYANFGIEKDLTLAVQKFKDTDDYFTVICIANYISELCDKFVGKKVL